LYCSFIDETKGSRDMITDDTDPIEIVSHMRRNGCLTPEDTKAVFDVKNRRARGFALRDIISELPHAIRSCFQQCFRKSPHLKTDSK